MGQQEISSVIAVIACGAIAKELLAIFDANGGQAIKLYCLPAHLHNNPDKIPAAVREKIEKIKDKHQIIFVAYGDCGTGGLLDAELRHYAISRLPGAHCYEFFSGSHVFKTIAEEEPGTYFLTDFLVAHFDRLVIKGLGLDRYPQLHSSYFGNYKRLVFVSQSGMPELQDKAKEYAAYIGVDYHYCYAGLAPLRQSLVETNVINLVN